MSNKFILFSVGFFFWCATGIAAERDTEIHSFENYSRVLIPVLNGATFKSRSAGDHSADVILQLENLYQGALGSLDKIKDSRVKALQSVSANELRLSLTQPSMEYFAYLQPSPPALVVDIWSKKTATAAVTKSEKTTAAPSRKLASLPTVKEKAQEKKTFTPSVEPLVLSNAIIQKFPQPMPTFTHKGVRFQIPFNDNLETFWSWQKPDKKIPGAGNFTFAQRLLKEKKLGLCIRTIELTERDLPTNKYMAELELLKAVAYKQLGEQTKQVALVQKSEEIYMDLINRISEDGKPFPFQISLKFYFATKAFKEEKWIDAIEQFEAISKLLPANDPDFAPLQMALAQGYTAINQFRKAERIYRFLVESYPGKEVAKESYYRRAAMLAMEKNYERAAEVSEEALKEYPEYQAVRTEIHFNLAESYFGLGNYKRASAHFHEFIQQHPSQTLSSLAYIRLGEIAELDKKNTAEARNFYLEAKDRFPYSLGSKIGSIRIARLNLNEEKDLSYPISQIRDIIKDNTLPPEAKKMGQAVLVEYLLKDDEYKEASAISLASMSDVASEAEYGRFRLLYVQSLVHQLDRYVKDGNYSAGLSFYEEQKKWFGMGGAIVWKHLSQLYRGLGLFDSSNKYMEMYGVEKRKELGGRSLASTGDDSGIHLVKAQNSYAQGKFAEALNYTSGLAPTSDVLRIRAGANAKLQRKKDAITDAEKAIMAFSKAKEKMAPSAFDDAIIDMTDILVSNTEEERNYSVQEDITARSINLLHKKNERYQFIHADALWYQRKHERALKEYKELLATYPKSDRVSRAKYNLAMSEIALGKRQDAVKTLTDLRDSSQNVWSQSAKQELELLDWEKKYSTVLRSLPPSGLGIVN